jgi:NitT/TauT family transport system substrate-binding protein
MNRGRLIRAGTAAFAASLAFPRAAIATDLSKITLGTAQTDSASEILSGINEGIYARAGLDVQPQTFTNGNSTFAAMLGGTLDLSGSNLLSLAVAYAKGAPIRMIATGAVYSTRNPTTLMVVAKDSKLVTARDLSGTTVGVNVLGGIAHVAAQAWIDKNGGDAKQVKFIELPNSSMGAALVSKRIDASILPEPFLSQSKGDWRFFSKAFDGFGPRWMIDGYIATQDWIAANRETARKFQRANLAASAWANRHPDQTAVFVAKGMNLDVAVVRGMARATFLEKTDLGAIQPVIDAGAQYGVLPQKFPAAELFAPDFLH